MNSAPAPRPRCAPMEFDQPSRHVQADTQSAAVAVMPKWFEDVRQDVRRDAVARITHCENHLRRTRGEMDAHAAARRRVLHRVVEHVRNDLLQTNRIALHDDGRRGRDLRHIDAALLRTRAKHADHVTNN